MTRMRSITGRQTKTSSFSQRVLLRRAHQPAEAMRLPRTRGRPGEGAPVAHSAVAYRIRFVPGESSAMESSPNRALCWQLELRAIVHQPGT
jgi:hypothetical protein